MHTIFIDGQQGTTGLQIRQRLAGRRDLTLLEIPEEDRKKLSVKKDLLNSADLVLLCLPDDAARESAALITEPHIRIIDASTAHRVAEGWTYGLPELSPEQRMAIGAAPRVANPGCHATGLICAVRPLVDAGILAPDYPLTAVSLTGYSGGGRRMIETYRRHAAAEAGPLACRPYALGLRHKHLPEMQTHAGLADAPFFEPCVGDFYAGMIVSVPLHTRLFQRPAGPEEIHAVLSERYEEQTFVEVLPWSPDDLPDDGFLSPTALNGTNRLELFVFGHEEQVLLCARFDNLGKGASGAAVQNLNLMLGLGEATGLR